jgi:hypothetical protein
MYTPHTRRFVHVSAHRAIIRDLYSSASVPTWPLFTYWNTGFLVVCNAVIYEGHFNF